MFRKYLEHSKKLTIIMAATFVLTLIACFVMPVVFHFDKDLAKEILSTVATLTGTTFIGYFGKSGVENYKKIERDFQGEGA